MQDKKQHAPGLLRRRFVQLAAGASAAMGGLLGKATAQTTAPVKPAGLEAFKGQLIGRSDPRYLGWFWAMSWYRIKPNRFPALFAQPKDVDDIKLLMAYAQQAKLRMVPRASGHNISNPVLAQDAITVDMSLFEHISEIDKGSKSLWAGPGVLSENLNMLIHKSGYSFPSAHTGFVTLGGFLLGGGMGWNMPGWGMGVASVLAAEVVLADGRVVMASPSENPDLYWAIRGVGPGFFGIITRYKLQLHTAPTVIKNVYFIGLDKLEAGVAECLRLLPESKFRTEVLGALGKFNPPGTPPDKQTWHWVLTLMSFGETTEQAQEAAKLFTSSELPKLAAANPATNVPLTYLDMYSQLSTDYFSQYRTSEIALFTDEPAKAMKILAEKLSTKALDQRSFGFSVLGTNPTVPEPASFTYAAPHYLSWYLMGTSNEDVAKNYALADELYEALDPLAKGYYMNEIDLDRFPQLARKAFSEEKWNKLLAVRKQYDPEQRFVSYLDKA